jgi:spore germination protein YaaH
MPISRIYLVALALVWLCASIIFAGGCGDSVREASASAQADERASTLTVSNTTQAEANIDEAEAADELLVFGYHAWWMGDRWRRYDLQPVDKLIFFEVRVDSTGGFETTNGYPETWRSMAQEARAAGVPVVPTIALFDVEVYETIMRDPARTDLLLRETLDLVREGDADGVHLDFEFFDPVAPDVRDAFTAWVRDLRQGLDAMRPGLQISVFATAFDHGDALDEGALVPYTDHFVAQGYDMHWLTGPSAGPLAPLDGWSGANWPRIVERFVAEGVPRSKLVMALPYYGYEWPTEGPELGSATRGEGRAITYAPIEAAYLPDIQVSALARSAEHGGGWDEVSASPFYAYEGEDGWYQGWYENERSIGEKMRFVEEEGLAGVAIFPLGYDDGRFDPILRAVSPR